MITWRLFNLFLIFRLVFAIDFRSNNYRQVFNNVIPTVDPIVLKNQFSNNPYFDLFTTHTSNLFNPSTAPFFPMAKIEKASTTQYFPTSQFWSTVTQPKTTVTSTTITPTTPTITTTKTTETVWTTTKSPLKLSKNLKLGKVGQKNGKTSSSFDSAQLSVLSHRLLNDVLIIPSSRRLYILAILPIHQASEQNFECGEIDVNAIVRLAEFLESLKNINESNMLKEIGADIGAIIIDSCSADLRSVADLYELLSGTNIQKNDLIAIVRDDSSYMPNTEQIMQQLNLPIVNTFFSAASLPHTTGTLPSMTLPIQAIISSLKHYQSSCVNLIFDEKYEKSAAEFHQFAQNEGICIEAFVSIKNGTTMVAEATIRRLLLSEARIVVVLLTEENWIQITKALRSEMVIAGRFVFIAVQDQRWTTSRKFVESWPTFEQHLVSITSNSPVNSQEEIMKLTDTIPKMTLPNAWLKQFWASAFKCHVENEESGGKMMRKFSKECANSQNLNISSITPDVDVSSIAIAATSIGIAFRKFVDRACPGALVISMPDCVNEPFDEFFQSILDLDFVHHLSDLPVNFNYSTGYRDVSLDINRVMFEEDRLKYSKLGTWDTIFGYKDALDTDDAAHSSKGSYVLMSSNCPKSRCAKEVAKNTVKQQLPSVFKALTDLDILVFAIFSVISCLTCLMCMYLKVISTCAYRNCAAVCFLGLAFLSLSSPAFIMPPNAISCALRKLLFPISFCITIAPIFVKTVLFWRYRDIQVKGSVLMTFSIIVIQSVISGEWMILSTDLPTEFVSSVHGTMWRCSPGDSSETTILVSCSLSAVLSVLSFIFAIAALENSQNVQHLIISILSIFFEIALYVALPLLPYKKRDIIMATAILIFSFVTLLVSHLNRPANGILDNGSIQVSTKNESWLQHVVMSPEDQAAMMQNYHTASTNPQSTIEKNHNITDETVHRKSDLYGSEAYELPSTTYA